MFINYANFYQRFIQHFNIIAVVLIFRFTITKLLDLVLKAFRFDNNEIIKKNSNKTNEMIINSSKNDRSKNLMHAKFQSYRKIYFPSFQS